MVYAGVCYQGEPDWTIERWVQSHKPIHNPYAQFACMACWEGLCGYGICRREASNAIQSLVWVCVSRVCDEDTLMTVPSFEEAEILR